jgi:hypothetical protein
MKSNSIFIMMIPKKKNKSQFIGHYLMSRYSNLLYDHFATELNLKSKPQVKNIKIRPNLIYGAISPLLDRI